MVKKMTARGHGTYGTVYMVQDPDTMRLYAAKVETLTATLHDELLFLQKLRHPSILKPIDFSMCSGGLSWIIMDCVPGSLWHFLQQRGPLSADGQLAMFLQVLSGLEHVHSKNIIHGDVKTGNILLDPATLKFYIIDFGLAYPLPVPAERKRATWCIHYLFHF